MGDKLKLQPERITQEVFDLMPALLSAYQVKLITGLDDHELAAARSEGQLKVWKRPVRKGRKRSYAKYTKVSVAAMVGFRV